MRKVGVIVEVNGKVIQHVLGYQECVGIRGRLREKVEFEEVIVDSNSGPLNMSLLTISVAVIILFFSGDCSRDSSSSSVSFSFSFFPWRGFFLFPVGAGLYVLFCLAPSWITIPFVLFRTRTFSPMARSVSSSDCNILSLMELSCSCTRGLVVLLELLGGWTILFHPILSYFPIGKPSGQPTSGR